MRCWSRSSIEVRREGAVAERGDVCEGCPMRSWSRSSLGTPLYPLLGKVTLGRGCSMRCGSRSSLGCHCSVV